jgi:diguanylate cyclase (GGDEF)-like protein/PAS domain S-box-containing protein
MPLSHRPELADVIDLLMDAVCVVDGDGRFVYVSAAGERIFGYRPEEMVGRAMLDFVAPEDHARTRAAAAQVMHGAALPYFENCYLRKDGRRVHIMWSARWSERHQLRIGVARDISERRAAQRTQQALYAISEAAHEAQDLSALLAQMHAILASLLPADNLCVWLREGEHDLLRTVYRVDARAPREGDEVPHPLAQRVAAGRAPLRLDSQADGPLRSLAGEPLACWLGVPLRGSRGVIGVLALQRYAGEAAYDGSDLELLQYVSTQIATAIERKRLQARLEHLAHYDALTGLPNRGLLLDRLEQALARARRQQQRLGVLFLDLDGFKRINDVHGHAVGDQLLVAAAERLRTAIRAADTVARIGGDEFVVLLEALTDADDAERIAAQLQERLAQPWEVPGLRLHAGASIGVALYPEHGDSASALLRVADETMYRSKRTRTQTLPALLDG